MNATRPSELIPEFRDVPEIDAAFARSYPFANVALAVTRLRGRLGLTQTEFAEKVGTTQSVVARLESGRHGIQISLFNRIAEAIGTDWQVTFGGTESANADTSNDMVASSSGDPLLDAFNEANTRSDVATAHRIALRIKRDQSSPRRTLALAIDAYNHGRFKQALEWSNSAMRGGLPRESDDAARLVAGRSLLALKRPKEALDVLTGAREGLAAATRAEALLELDRVADAVKIAEHLLEVADPAGRPAAMFLAARVYWHANLPYAALTQAAGFRAVQPEDAEGALIHGAILGYIGDTGGDTDAYRQARRCFNDIPADEHPGVLRLRAMTAARLGEWREALDCLRQSFDGNGRPAITRQSASEVAIECFDRLDEADVLDAAVDHASTLKLIDDDVRRSYKAFANAMRGDFEAAVSALETTIDRLHEASPADQIRCATALAVGHQAGRALPILMRNQDELSVPDGYLFLAQAALSERELDTARMALRRIAQHQGDASETARVAVDLLSAIDRAGTEAVLDRLSLTWQAHRPRVLDMPVAATAPASPWEGPASHGELQHDPASPVLDRMTRELVAQMPVH